MIALLDIMTVLLEYIDQLLYLPKNLAYYAGIMLDTFRYLLCSKLCRHNWRKPKLQACGPKESLYASVLVIRISFLLDHMLAAYGTFF